MTAIPPSKRFVGLDLSLTSTGVAILRREGQGWGTPELHVIREKVSKPTPLYKVERLGTILSRLQGLNVFGPDVALLALEDYAYGISSHETNCVFQLGELGGVVRLQLLNTHTPFLTVPIGTNKKFATGNGAADKSLVASKIAALWGIPLSSFPTNDASDALSLATVAAYKHLGNLDPIPTYKFQRPLVQGLEVLNAGTPD